MLNMVFSITYYSELHLPICFHYYFDFYQLKMFMFYNVQTQLWHCINPTRVAPIKIYSRGAYTNQDPLTIYRVPYFLLK